MQAVVAQQHAVGGVLRSAPAGQLAVGGELGLGPVLQADHQVVALDGVADGVSVGAARQRGDLVQQLAGIGDNLAAALGIIALAAGRRLQGVGAVEGVIEAAPARIGGVQGVAGVGHRHHELRAGQPGDLGIDVLGVDLEGRRGGQQIADLAQEGGLFGDADILAAALAPPGVDRGLQLVPTLEQLGVARGEVGQDGLQRRPEGFRLYARARQQLAFDKGVQKIVDRKGVADVHARNRALDKAFSTPPRLGDVLARPLYCTEARGFEAPIAREAPVPRAPACRPSPEIAG